MKTTAVFRVVLSLLIFSGYLNFSAAQKLEFATLDDFAPFTWQVDGEAFGIDVDILKEMCERMSVECDINFLPWNRVLHNTEEGLSAGGFAAFQTAEREAYAHFLEVPLHYSTFSVFVKLGNEFQFNSIADLSGKSIGLRSGFAINDEFAAARNAGSFEVEEVNSVQANIAKLENDRIDALIGNRLETLYLIKNEGLAGKIIPLPMPIVEPRGAYLMISKDADIADKEALIATMNETLRVMESDGTFERINALYTE